VLAEFFTKTVPPIAWCWQNFTQRQFHPLPDVGRILPKDSSTHCLVLASFSALVLGLALLTPKV
jgi:hypothetical protein